MERESPSKSVNNADQLESTPMEHESRSKSVNNADQLETTQGSNPDHLDVDIYAITTVAFDNAILDAIRSSYSNDKLFGPVIANPERYPCIRSRMD